VNPRQFWDERFGSESYAYGSEPNDFLRLQAGALPPGDALCLAEGEGRNAVHLARLGHRVVAQDLSPVGLRKAQQLAASRGVAIRCECYDLQSFDPQANSFDLVVAIWMHLEPSLRAQVLRRRPHQPPQHASLVAAAAALAALPLRAFLLFAALFLSGGKSRLTDGQRQISTGSSGRSHGRGEPRRGPKLF